MHFLEDEMASLPGQPHNRGLRRMLHIHHRLYFESGMTDAQKGAY